MKAHLNGRASRRMMVALALAIGCATASAQTPGCGALSDPNDPQCRAGTASPAAPLLPGGAAPRTAPGQQPGMGQQVCAFFDTRTNRCLTMRPNTRDYDAAVQVGVEGAMMGMQVQADALERVRQMGLSAGFGLPAGDPSAAPGLGTGIPASAASPADGASCLRQLQGTYRARTGRDPAAAEVVVLRNLCP